VSAWEWFSKYEKELFDNKEFLKYNEIHWISINLAESLADILHKQIRKDLDILDKDKWANLTDVQKQRYHWARYSFWYNACPNLEDNQIIFDLLKPEEFWITLGETFQMHPEQTTSALVVHHKDAKYW
jgi:5-methyltetrahydrofolate--homocysteine methyltransferase